MTPKSARSKTTRLEYYQKNRERILADQKKCRDKIRDTVFFHYSSGEIKCKNCEFDDVRALCIDHINHDGAEERQKLAGVLGRKDFRGISADAVYRSIIKRGFPRGYQVLCYNCNRIKTVEYYLE